MMASCHAEMKEVVKRNLHSNQNNWGKQREESLSLT